MTSSQIARLLHGRRIGRGKWMAKCCAHPDKTASLSITEMQGGNTRLHCFSGCPQQAVVEAAGLKWGDLTLESVPDPYWAQKRAEEDRISLIEKRVGLAILMGAIEPLHKRYWDAVERNGMAEIERTRDRSDPSRAAYREVRRIIEEYGIPELMECVDPRWEIDDSGPHNLPAKTWDCYRIAGKFKYRIAGMESSGKFSGDRGVLIYEEGIGK